MNLPHGRNRPAVTFVRQAAAVVVLAVLMPACGFVQAQEKVHFASLDHWGGPAPLQLDGYLYKPADRARYVALVMFHGCGGALQRDGKVSQRFRDMAALLNGMGYGVLLVDSFNPRGARQICTTPLSARAIGDDQRWLDGFGAVSYLNGRADVVTGGIGAIGFSHGGTAAVQVMNAELPPKKDGMQGFAASVAFYPGCGPVLSRKPPFRAYAPLLILAGELDDWTPASQCVKLVERTRSRGEAVELEIYPGAYHGFDETTPVKLRTDVIRGGHGVHVGGNPAARAAAYERVRQFFGRYLPAR